MKFKVIMFNTDNTYSVTKILINIRDIRINALYFYICCHFISAIIFIIVQGKTIPCDP